MNRMSSGSGERRPCLPGWEQRPTDGLPRNLVAKAHGVSAWQYGPTCVLSALVDAELPDKSGTGPTWHISVSRMGKRPKDHDLRRALRAFQMQEAEEDNHHPGNARHFFLSVDPAHRTDCECKETEDRLTEPDGYRWQNPKPGHGECRGCELAQVTGRPCPIHGAEPEVRP